jgi:predicted nuclease with TOPRIM domain
LYEYEYVANERYTEWDTFVEKLRNRIATLIESNDLYVIPDLEESLKKFENKVSNLQKKLDIQDGTMLEMCASLSELRSDLCHVEVYDRVFDYFITGSDPDTSNRIVVCY